MMNHILIIVNLVVIIIALVLAILYWRKVSPENYVGAPGQRVQFDNNKNAFFSTPSIETMPPPRSNSADLNRTINFPIVNNMTDVSSWPQANSTGNCGTSDCPPTENYIFKKEDGIETYVTDSKPPPSIVVDRQVFANRNSQLRAVADKIRGDLPIAPAPPGWFRPSVTPQIDLEPGAMNVLTGANESTTKFNDLINASMAGLLPAADHTPSTYSPSVYAQLGNRGDDLTMTSQL